MSLLLPAQRALLRTASEAEFQKTVCEWLDLFKWGWWHNTDSRKNKSGLPDLYCWRERAFWAELKTETGRLSRAQKKTIAEFRAAGVVVFVWRPRDLDEIERVLR